MPVRPPSFRPKHLPEGQTSRLYDRDRGTRTDRGYDNRWLRARSVFLKQHPLCAICETEGRITPATLVDHRVPHRGNMVFFWDQTNWQSLCPSCHSRKTRAEGGGGS